MKAGSFIFALLVPLALQAQDQPPAGLAEVELARSRACVGTLSRLEELDRTLAPYSARLERLRALGRAVTLEDPTEAAPLAEDDPVEGAVARWFVQDSVLAARWVAERDDGVQEERTRARDAMVETLRQAMQVVGGEAQAQLGDAAELEAAALPCEGAIFVRSAVVEACAGGQSTLCQAAATTEPGGPFRFVDAPEDLWDVGDYRPWTQPGPLQVTAQGALVGGRTGSQARKGNVIMAVGLAPLIRNRAELTEEEIADFEANLDSLGFTFQHPLVVMAPAIEVTANVPSPIGGETHLLLHFGDLSGPDVIWSSEVGEGGVFQALFPAAPADLVRLQAGEVVSLTAVRVPEVPEGETPEAEPVYTVSLLQVGQTQQVSALLQYMGGGGLNRDLAALLTPPPAGGAPGR